MESEYQFERRMFGSSPEQLRSLAAWLLEQEAEEVVMESTAQYWKPVWGALERYLEAVTREARRRKAEVWNVASGSSAIEPRTSGRKKDFPDAERLVKRLVARELTLSFVPDAEQRLWRTVMRRKYQLTRTACGCRTNWSLFWKRPTLSCPAWSRICWALVPVYAEGAR